VNAHAANAIPPAQRILRPYHLAMRGQDDVVGGNYCVDQSSAINSVADALVHIPHAALPVVVAFGAMVSFIRAVPSTERFSPSCPTTCGSASLAIKPKPLPIVSAIVK